MARRIIVDTPVGLGTPQGYKLACPNDGTVNITPDAGTSGHETVDGTHWYYFDCTTCGCKYKAEEIPLDISHLMRSFDDVLKGLMQ